jgi:hypothetical protein
MMNGVNLKFPYVIFLTYLTGFKKYGTGNLFQGTMPSCVMDFRDGTLSMRISNVLPFATNAADSDHTASQVTKLVGYICSRERNLVHYILQLVTLRTK